MVTISVESNELSLQDSIIGGYVDGVGIKRQNFISQKIFHLQKALLAA